MGSLSLHIPWKAMWGHKQEEGPHQESSQAGTLILDFQPPEPQEINVCCLSHLVYVTLL